MDFLRSLVLRSLGEAKTVEPPRIPYVSVYPETASEDAEPVEPLGTTPPPPAGEPPARPPTAPVDPPRAPPRAPAGEGRAGEAPAVVPRPEAPPAPAESREPAAPARPARATEDERRTVTAAPTAPQTADPERRTPAPPAERQETVRTIHETTRINDVQRVHHHVDRLVEREIIRPPAPVERRATRAPRERAPSPPIQPRARPDAVPRLPVQAAPFERSESPATPPAVHVSIGRVTVAVQAPAPPTRPTGRARPAAPAMDLDAYNARLRKPR